VGFSRSKPSFHRAFSRRAGSGRQASPHVEGFSLPEMMIAMAVTVILSSLIWVNYQSQHEASLFQIQTLAMQEDLRSTMTLIADDLRMAGYDPIRQAGRPPVGTGILLAGRDRIRITMDLNGDGDTDDPNEDVDYRVKDSDGGSALHRKSSSGGRASFQPVINHVEAIDFVYLDRNGKVLDDDGQGSVTERVDRISSIQILLAVRSPLEDRKVRHTAGLFNLQGRCILPASQDAYRRASLIEAVYCRNLRVEDDDARS